jgi:hypothetical protein
MCTDIRRRLPAERVRRGQCRVARSAGTGVQRPLFERRPRGFSPTHRKPAYLRSRDPRILRLDLENRSGEGRHGLSSGLRLELRRMPMTMDAPELGRMQGESRTTVRAPSSKRVPRRGARPRSLCALARPTRPAPFREAWRARRGSRSPQARSRTGRRCASR